MVSKILNYFSYTESLAAGGQPTSEQIEALKNEGFEVVVSLSPTSTPNYLPLEAELTEKLNLEYIHYPVDCSNLKEGHYSVFSNVLKGLGDKKIFVHCGGNIKSSNLIHMYNVLESGISEQDSINELKKIQQPEEKWFNYFKRMGMQGLS